METVTIPFGKPDSPPSSRDRQIPRIYVPQWPVQSLALTIGLVCHISGNPPIFLLRLLCNRHLPHFPHPLPALFLLQIQRFFGWR